MVKPETTVSVAHAPPCKLRGPANKGNCTVRDAHSAKTNICSERVGTIQTARKPVGQSSTHCMI